MSDAILSLEDAALKVFEYAYQQQGFRSGGTSAARLRNYRRTRQSERWLQTALLTLAVVTSTDI